MLFWYNLDSPDNASQSGHQGPKKDEIIGHQKNDEIAAMWLDI